MRSRWLLLPAAAFSVAFTSCVNRVGPIAGNHPTGTGPFDSRGNYIEAWADNPSQWRKGSAQVVEAQPDRPAAVVPVTPPVLASTPPRRSSSSTPVVASRPKPRPSSVASNSAAKPKPVVRKPVVKAKPKATRHSVRSGDNLYNIAKRYGTSVGAIQRANGIKGAMIRPGQSLVIPR